MIIRNLLIEDHENSGTEWGFIQGLEGDVDHGWWRWALGIRQTISFSVSNKKGGCLFYELSIPDKGTSISILANGVKCSYLQAAKNNDIKKGFFEIPALANNLSSISLVFDVEILNPDQIKIDNSGKFPLAFAFYKLSYCEYPEFTDEEIKKMNVNARTGVVPPNLCAIPFNELYVDPWGVVYACCESMPTSNTKLFDAGVRVRNSDDLRRAWNRPQQRSIRQEMLLGRRPAACSRCYEREDKGKASIRNGCSPEELSLALTAAAQMDDSGNLPFQPNGIDIRLGNFCNLKCRMCFPYHSVNLVEDFNELHGEHYSSFKTADWMDGKILGAIAEASSHSKWITVAGGEPFITPQFKTLLEEYIRRGYAEKMTLKVITNATVLREEILQLFNSFKEVYLTVSLEGYGEVNDYIRYPSKFKNIDKNLQFLHEKMHIFNIKHVAFNTSLQVHNIFKLPELFRYLSQFTNFFWFPELSLVTEPDYLSIAILPRQAKNSVMMELKDYLDVVREQWGSGEKHSQFFDIDYINNSIQGVINYLFSEDKSSLIPEFLRVNNYLDKKRQQRTAIKIPGIHDLVL